MAEKDFHISDKYNFRHTLSPRHKKTYNPPAHKTACPPPRQVPRRN